MKDGVSGMLLALAELPVGMSAEVVALGEELRGRKKFADVGVVPGMKLVMQSHAPFGGLLRVKVQSHAPFGGLLRVKVLGSTIALHRSEGKNIQVRTY